MKEKNDEEDEHENNINLNIDIEKSNSLHNSIISKDECNEEERKNLSLDSSLKEIKLENKKVVIKKIRCPYPNCFENCIIMVDPNFFEVKFDCGKHNKKIDIIQYIKDSVISKDDKDKCSKCELTYEKIKEDKDNKILYKCYCGKNICKKCKKDHLDENKENKKEHNMIDFKYKDYKCGCSNKGKKFSSFCLTCKKNLCQICDENHKDHVKKNFGELSNLTEEKKKMLIQQIEIQKKLIGKFNEIIDDWYKRVKNIIDKYKTKLELYYQINQNIINRYDPHTNYYEEIKNTEYIRTDFDENFYNLIISEGDLRKQNSIICKILNENMDLYLFNSKTDNEKIFKNITLKDTKPLNGCIKHLCELKKEGALIVNINNNINNKEELCLFKEIEDKSEDNNKLKKYAPQFSKDENLKILSLKVLKSGYLLIVNKKQFNIYETSGTATSLKIIQNKKLEEGDEIFKNIIELINGYLVSISYSNNDKNKNSIIFWKKNIMIGNYEKNENINIKPLERPIDIVEINKEKFVVLFENNILYCFNSKNGDLKELPKIDSPNNFKKMIKIIEDGILFMNNNNFLLYSLSSLQQKSLNIQYNIIDIFYISNSNNNFLASFSEENNHGFLLLNIDFLKYKIDKIKILCNEAHSLKINCIHQLNNGDIITGSDDKTIKIWKTV